MATTEHNVLPIYQDENGNKYILYPITKAELVDGLQDFLDEKHANLKNNPHGVTLEQVGGAAASHQHAAGDITSGILPVARGGTGVASIAELLTALGLGEPVKIATGEYTGTGVYGKDNKNTLNFAFVPELVIIGSRTGYGPLVMMQGMSTATVGNTTTCYDVYPVWSDTSVSWYCSKNVEAQLNRSDMNYKYVIIG